MSAYRKLRHIYDGDAGPVYEINPDLGTNFDASHAALVFYVQDSAGNTLGVRPGVIVSPKSDRKYHFQMKGRETDWDGLGKQLYVIPRVYAALAPDRTPAVNLLLNPSFDTYNATMNVASCTTTSGSRKVTSSAAFGKVYAGMTVSGTGIPGGTFVDAVLDSSTLFLSAAATGSASVTLTFGRFGLADDWNMGGGSFNVTCTTNGTTLLTSAGAFGNVNVGMKLYGDFIPDGTTVLSKADSSNLTMSAAATGSSSAVRAFCRTGYGLGSQTLSHGADDPAPPTIFGSRQRIYATNTVGTDQVAFIQQSVSVSASPGDYFSSGVWARAKLDPYILVSCTTNGTTTVTSAAAFGSVVAGMAISGTGIPAGAYVESKADSSTITISVAATDSTTAGRLFGTGLIGEPGYYLSTALNASAGSAKTFHPAGDRDWQFVAHSFQASAAATSLSLNLISYDALGYDIRYDDAFLFKGTWSEYHLETFELEVKGRARPSKTNGNNTNHIAGRGGFEEDSNGDGVADFWGKIGTTNTYTIEVDPDHVNTVLGGLKAQKITLAASTADYLVLLVPGKYTAGQTWRFQVAYKNSGPLSGSPANGDFGIILETEPFDGPFEQSSLAGANFNLTSVSNYTTKFRTLTLTADRSVLVCKVNLKTASGGAIWIDDAQLLGPT